MIVQRLPDQITRWSLVFWPAEREDMRGIALLWPGRFKHVSAFAWSEPCRTWVYYNVRLMGTELILLPPGEESERWLAWQLRGCSILQMQARPQKLRLYHYAFHCVPAMSHLVGLARCGARPDTFWRKCIENGAQVIFDGRRRESRRNRLRSWLAGNRRHEFAEPRAAGGTASGGQTAAD